MCVVDIDKHHGGDITMRELIARYGDYPKGPLQQTPRGGHHAFFAYDKRITRNSNNLLGPGIDIKTTGGGIALAPSYWNGVTKGKKVFEGGHYEWIRAPRGNHLPMMPGWMIKLLMPKPVRSFAKKDIDRSDVNLVKTEQALNYVPNHDYAIWVRMGMALKAEFGDAGYDLWRNWSGAGYSEFDQAECEATWRSFKRTDGVGIGSLFYEARLAGADLSGILEQSRGKELRNT